MTKEVEKAIKKARKKASKKNSKLSQIKNWWGQNNYKVYRVIFFPIWIITIILEKIKNYSYSHNEWSKQEVDRILNYYVPRRAKYDEEEKTFYLYYNCFGETLGNSKKYLKRKDRKFWKKYNRAIHEYLKKEYELVGFKKINHNCSNGVEIEFVQM